MNAFILALLLIGGDDFQWSVTESPSFSWNVTEGGDNASLSNDSAVPGTDAPTTSGAAPGSALARSGAASDLRSAIKSYRESGGVRYFVRGKSDWRHLIEDHGWKAEQIRGLGLDELQFLHGATHTGRINPSNYVAVTPSAPFTPEAVSLPPSGADTKPVVKCFTQANCKSCRNSEKHDWSSEEFTVTHTDKAPDWVEAFPCYYWQAKSGRWKYYYGFSPGELRRTWKATQ